MNNIGERGEEGADRVSKKRQHSHEAEMETQIENPITHNKKARVDDQSNTAHPDTPASVDHDDDNARGDDTSAEAAAAPAETSAASIIGTVSNNGGKQRDLMVHYGNLPFTFPEFQTLKHQVNLIVLNVSGTKRRFEQTLGNRRIDMIGTRLGQELGEWIKHAPAAFKAAPTSSNAVELHTLWRDGAKTSTSSWVMDTHTTNGILPMHKTHSQLVDLLLAMAMTLSSFKGDCNAVEQMADEFVAFLALDVCDDGAAIVPKGNVQKCYRSALQALKVNGQALANWTAIASQPKLSKEDRMKLRHQAIELFVGTILQHPLESWQLPKFLSDLWKKRDFDSQKKEDRIDDATIESYVNKIYNPISARQLERENGAANMSLHQQKAQFMALACCYETPENLKFFLDLIEEAFHNGPLCKIEEAFDNGPLCNVGRICLRSYLSDTCQKYPCALTEELYNCYLPTRFHDSKVHPTTAEDFFRSNQTSGMVEFFLNLMNLMVEECQLKLPDFVQAVCSIRDKFPHCPAVIQELQRISKQHPELLPINADIGLPVSVPNPFTPKNFVRDPYFLCPLSIAFEEQEEAFNEQEEAFNEQEEETSWSDDLRDAVGAANKANAAGNSILPLNAFQKAGAGQYLDPADFVCDKFLGSGTFQHAFRAYCKRFNTHVALKVRCPTKDQLVMVARFFEITAKLDDFSVVRPLGFFRLGGDGERVPLVVIEQLGLRDLESLLGEVNDNKELNFSAEVTASHKVQGICRKRMQVFAKPILQILEATAHAHLRKVIIRDIKTENIMEKRDTPGGKTRWALSDNGEVKNSNSGVATHNIGTTAYLAPEADKPDRNTTYEKTDNFAIGIIIYELLTGSIRSHQGVFQKRVSDVWFDMVDGDIIDKHRKNIFKYEVVGATGERVPIGKKIRTLIEELLAPYNDRITVQNALEQWEKIVNLHDPQLLDSIKRQDMEGKKE